jgi:hypothetical protein
MNLHLNCVSESGEHIDSFSLYQTPTETTWKVLGDRIFLQKGIEPYLSRYIEWRNPPRKLNEKESNQISEILTGAGFEKHQSDFIINKAINEDSEIEHIEDLIRWIEKNKNRGIIEWSAQ